jgi:hypothetical protein
VGALLQIAGLVDDQRRLWVAKVGDHVVADIVADLVFVPHRPRQEVLHPVGAVVADVFSDRPAVPAGQVRQQPAHECPGPPAQVGPGKPASDPAQQLLEQLLPAGWVYLCVVVTTPDH